MNFIHATTSSTLLVLAALAALTAPNAARAEPLVYEIDPTHTYPSFEADHLGGLSTWRGKFNRTTGKVTLDKAAGNGSIEVFVDIDSIDFGNDEMNVQAKKGDLFDAEKFPQATYVAKLEGFKDGVPTRAVGELTLLGVTRPVVLAITSFKCMPHPMLKREVCGADAHASFQRDEFGITAGKDYGFGMQVTLRIQVEAVLAK